MVALLLPPAIAQQQPFLGLRIVASAFLVPPCRDAVTGQFARVMACQAGFAPAEDPRLFTAHNKEVLFASPEATVDTSCVPVSCPPSPFHVPFLSFSRDSYHNFLYVRSVAVST